MSSASAGRLAALGLGLTLAAGLVSCAAPDDGPGVAQERTRGVPDGYIGDPIDSTNDAVWIDKGTRFAVVTYGSSSCPRRAEAIEVTGADSLEITFAPADAEVCTADLAPTTHEFDLPDGITASPVRVTLAYTDWPETDTVELP